MHCWRTVYGQFSHSDLLTYCINYIIANSMFSCNSPHSVFLSIFHFPFFFFPRFIILFCSLHFVQSVSSFQCCTLWLADSCQRGRWWLASFGHEILLCRFCIGCLYSPAPFILPRLTTHRPARIYDMQ